MPDLTLSGAFAYQDAKLSAAVKLLGQRKIGAVLVMSKGQMEGILSERDIVRVLGERGAAVLDEPVSAVMTRKVVSCKQSDTVAGIMEMMTHGKFSRGRTSSS